jgi:hypothetical protein
MAAMSTHAEPMIGIISAGLPFLTLGHYFGKICRGVRRLLGKETNSAAADREEDEEVLSMSIIEMNRAHRLLQTQSTA